MMGYSNPSQAWSKGVRDESVIISNRLCLEIYQYYFYCYSLDPSLGIPLDFCRLQGRSRDPPAEPSETFHDPHSSIFNSFHDDYFSQTATCLNKMCTEKIPAAKLRRIVFFKADLIL
jgi:hypothetical protein